MSPYKSTLQRKFMHARHPEIAKRWDKEYGGEIVKSKGVKEHSPSKCMRREGTA